MLMFGGSTFAIIVVTLVLTVFGFAIGRWVLGLPARAVRALNAWWVARALHKAHLRIFNAQAAEAEQRALNEQLK